MNQPVRYKLARSVTFSAVLWLSPTVSSDAEMNFSDWLLPAPSQARFADADHYIWGASMVRDAAGTCHLFYSRWPRRFGFPAWVTHSEIAHAVSDNPTGPFQHVDVALPARGAEHWDGRGTHNPTVHEFDGRYYLYYTGNTGDGQNTEGLNWSHRNNQRIGVAVADHPNGPWQRFDRPLIDVAPNPDAPDALLTSNPAICRRPDGSYLLVYKCVGKKQPLPFGGPVVHLAATSRSPTGPFQKHPHPVFTARNDSFPAEDPYLWAQDGRLWAIVKDMHGAFTSIRRSTALFQSASGLDWELAPQPLVTKPEIAWETTGLEKLTRLERPQLWLAAGRPRVLYCAAMDQQGNTFNVAIPLFGQ